MTSDPFETGSRTVLTVAEHFEGLKAEALAMHETFGTGERGYFTPSEEERVLHLVVSYHQARNALLELIASLRASPDAFSHERPRVFAVGYAAAVLLVDAARFLRDLFDVDPIVGDRLNRGEPTFGIPDGLYNQIQKSLTDPAHALALHEANRHFDQHQAALKREAAGDERLTAVLRVIEKLGDRVRVPKRQYVKARLMVRAREAKEAITISTIGRAIYAVQELVSRTIGRISLAPAHRPALPPEVRRRCLEILRPGDLLITRKEHALTNYFLPGYWPHAAMYLGQPEDLEAVGVRADHPNVMPRWTKLAPADDHAPQRVLEALADGVRIRSVDSPFSVDALCLLRPCLPKHAVAEAITRGLYHEGKPYDFDFDFTRSDRMVCTEVVYRSYENVVDGFEFQLTRRAGRHTLSAEDLLRDAVQGQRFEPLLMYRPESGREPILGPDAARAITASLGAATAEPA